MKGFSALKVAALLCGLGVAGCNGQLGLRFGEELCDTARPCSTGFVCDNGVCVPGGLDNTNNNSGPATFDEEVDLPDLEEGTEPPVENTCRVDAQCRDDEACIDGRCLTQPCANVACGDGEQCSFSCIPTEDSCDGVICDGNLETCIGGRCVPSCTADTCDTGCDTANDPNCGPDGVCRDGTLCVQGREFGRCVPYLPCDDRFCADGFLCTLNAGGCAPENPCDPSPCNPGWSCQVRNGLPVCVESACSGKICGPGETCRSGNCIDECESVPCEDGGRLCPDAGQACCDGVCCAAGLQCRGLECLPPEGVCEPDCGPGQICVNSQCFCRENPSVPCQGGECCVPLMSGGPDVPGIAECLDVCADNPCPADEPLCVRDCSVPEGFRCASSCDEITCELPNTVCDPTDGGCKCGAEQETCDDDECCDGGGCVDPCLGNPCSGEAVNRGCRRDCNAPNGFECIDLCADTVCAIPGTTCDPNDGLCKCGLDDQFCASVSFCCVDGMVEGYENDSGERCVSDPCEGDPCNGQQCIKDCAIPDGFFCVDNCAEGSGGETVSSCAGDRRNPDCDASTPGGRCFCAPPGVESNTCAGTERCIRDTSTDGDGVETGPDGDGSGNVLGCDDPCSPHPCGPLDCVRDGDRDKGFRCVDRCNATNLARVTDRNPDCDRRTGDPWCEVAARACTDDEVCVRDVSMDTDGADVGPDGDGSVNVLGCSANPCAGDPCGELECAEDPTLEKGFRCINNCRPEEVGSAAPSCSDDEPNNPDCNPIDGDCSCREGFGVFSDCELDQCCNSGSCDSPCDPNPCPASGDGADQTRCLVECDNDSPTGRDFRCADPCDGVNCEEPSTSATAGPNNPQCFPDGNDFSCGCTDGDTQCRPNQCCNPNGTGCYDPCVGNPCGTDPQGRTLCVASCSFSDDGLPDFECRNPCDPNPCVDSSSPFFDARTNPICVPQPDGSPLCTCDDGAVCDEAAGDTRDNVAFCAINAANPQPSTSTCVRDPCDDDANAANGLDNACLRGEGPSAETTLCNYTAPNAPRDGTNEGFVCIDPCTIDVGPGGCDQPNPVQFRYNDGRNCRCLCELETAQTNEANTSLGECTGGTAFCEGTGSTGRSCNPDPCGDIAPGTPGLQTVCTGQAPNTTCIRDLDDPTGVGFDCDNPCDPNICPPAGSPGAVFCTSEDNGTASCGCGGGACDGPTNFCDIRGTPTCVDNPCAGNPCAANPTNTECVLDLTDVEGDGDGFVCVDPCPANACNTSNDRLFGPVPLRQGDQCLCVCEVATATRCNPNDSPAGRRGFARCVGSGNSRTCDPDVCDSDDGTSVIDNPCPVAGVDDADEFECRRQNNVNNVDGFTCRDPCTNGRRNQCRDNEAPANPDCFGLPDGSFDCGCGDTVCGDGSTPNAFCTNADVCILDPCDIDNNPANGIQNRCNAAPPAPGLTRCVYDDAQPEGFLCVDPCPTCSQPRPDRFVSNDGNSCVCGCGDDDTDAGFNCSGNTAVCTGTGPGDRVCLADPCDSDPGTPGRQPGVCPGSGPGTNTLCRVDETRANGFECLNPCDENDPCVDGDGDPLDPANPFCEPTASGGTVCVCSPGDDCGRNGSDIFAPNAFCANSGDSATAVCVEDPCDDPNVSGFQNRCLSEGGASNTRCEYRTTAPGYVCVNPCVGVSCSQPEPDVVRFNDGQSCGCSCGAVDIAAPVANSCTGDTCDAGTCVGDACAAFPCDTLPNTFCERDSGAPNGRRCLDPCASNPCGGSVNPNCEAQLGGTAACVCEPGEECGGSPNAICVGGNTCVLDPCDDPSTPEVDNRCANSSSTATRCVYRNSGNGFRCEDPCQVDGVSCGTQPEPTRVRFNDGASCGCACGVVDIGEPVLPDCSGPFAFCDSTGTELECRTEDPCGDISSAPGLQTVCSANEFNTRCNRDLGNLSGPGFFCSAPCDDTDCSGVVNPICEPLEDGTAVCVCEPGSVCTGTNPFCDLTMGTDAAQCVANVCDPNLCPAGGDPGATRCVPDDASPDGFSCVDPCAPNPCSGLANPICQRDGNFFDCVCEGDQVCGDGANTPNAVCDRETTPGTPICREDPCAGNPCLPATGGRTQCVIDLGEGTGFTCINPCEEGGNDTCAEDAANPFCEPTGDTFRCVCAPATRCDSGPSPFCVQSTRTCDPNPCAGDPCGGVACVLDDSEPNGFVCVNYCEAPQFPSGVSCDALTDGRNPRCNPADSDPDLEDRCGCGASFSVCSDTQLCCPILGGGGGEACAPQQCAGDFDCSFPLICDPCIGCVDPAGG